MQRLRANSMYKLRFESFSVVLLNKNEATYSMTFNIEYITSIINQLNSFQLTIFHNIFKILDPILNEHHTIFGLS